MTIRVFSASWRSTARLAAGSAWNRLLYHSDTYNENKDRRVDDDHSLAVPGTLDIRFTPGFFLAWGNRGHVGGFEERYPVLSTSLRATTNKHTFALVVSNTQ